MAKKKPTRKAKPASLWDRSKGRTLEERFWAKVKVGREDECWIWTAKTAGRRPHLYGHFWDGVRTRKAHQVSWELKHGKPFPKGKICCHSCDNPVCVNPNHLFVGTFKTNTLDMFSKGRQGNIQGERCGHAKLTSDMVEEIKHLYKTTDLSQYKLAQQFGICQAQISRILRGERWSHIGG